LQTDLTLLIVSAQYNHIKDLERLSEQKSRELQSVKEELARTRKSSSEEKARLSAKMAEIRELKRQVTAKQGAKNDEILDREVRLQVLSWHNLDIDDGPLAFTKSLITNLKSELSKEQEK
jgi:hypothetical protein